MIVVCFYTESWTYNHNKLTEIGISTFDSRDMRALMRSGSYGENLLKQIYFYHARIQETRISLTSSIALAILKVGSHELAHYFKQH